MIKQYPASWLSGVSLGESIACELRLQIIRGTIRPGEVLSENRIAADFGTSRSPVREAMKTLSNEGLIRLERMGAVVTGLSLKDVGELYDLRYLIESFVQERLVGSDISELLNTLGKIVDKMRLAAQHHDIVEFSYQDLSFHEAIITEANHTRILHLWKNIRQLVMTVMLITTENVFKQGDEKVKTVIGKHEKLIEGLASGDAERIHEGVLIYFADSRTTLSKSIPNN
ncbi:GntR family transcriptional regulator [Paenibacillus sediminis]|uniref:GntR family transcriptional regulator of gluconate operon n=1 Tax=Paenibacillus sediminis TaxID=664909 RepID=A0ABS4H4V8_9BACL|nr:GntR family transcriptional regulator [Paenibacillus sediminis]MBP1937568.1 GntR family transcriptional regulator of gluconate operon [Paenibacillus sediminis]